MSQYDANTFDVVFQQALAGTISAAAANSAYIGSSLKVSRKSLVLGVHFVTDSGGSAAATNSIHVARMNSGGTLSNWHTETIVTSAGASASGDVASIDLTSAMTVHSIGEAAVLRGGAASTDKMRVLRDVIWRYKVLPTNALKTESNPNTQ